MPKQDQKIENTLQMFDTSSGTFRAVPTHGNIPRFLDCFFLSEKVSVSQERVSGFPEKGADLRGSSGNFRGSLEDFRGSLGNFRGTSGLPLSSTVRELPGKWPKNFRGSSGKFRGSPGTSQELGGVWLPPSDSPNLSPFICKHSGRTSLTEFRGANSVSSFQPIICVQTRTHRVSRRTHRVCRRTQWVLSSETVLSKQYSARSLKYSPPLLCASWLPPSNPQPLAAGPRARLLQGFLCCPSASSAGLSGTAIGHPRPLSCTLGRFINVCSRSRGGKPWKTNREKDHQ